MTDRRAASSTARRLSAVALTVAWVGAFTATHVPIARLATSVSISDKIMHLIGYFGLTSLFILAMAVRGRPRAWRVGMGLGVMAVYGALDELTQPLVNRSASWADWSMDLAGTVLAICVWEIILAYRAKARGRKTG